MHMNMKIVASAALAWALLVGAVLPSSAASPTFSEVTGESAATLTPCVMDGLSLVGISSEQMLVDLLTSGPHTRDAVANQLRAIEAACYG
jgi:hypothetical protein